MRNDLQKYMDTIPAVGDASRQKETFWLNDKKIPNGEKKIDLLQPNQIEDARLRLERFAPYLKKVFPELEETGGIIESELREIAGMKDYLDKTYGAALEGRLMLKMDSHLPVSGSVKARGGIYEVLKHAEDLVMESGLLRDTDDYRVLAEPKFQEFFGKHTVQVGSTGNLGMSIGIMSAKLGFHVIVHMSADAKQWKKDLLRSRGVEVIEYSDDYCAAVEQGRKNSDADEMSYFVDDENSQTLFLGYAVAALRLKEQLEKMGCAPGPDRPLFAFLPCGVGGGPGGVAFGLKLLYGEDVHCFFAEPTHAPCMTLGLASGLHDRVCVQDFGIDNRTAADGLAVGRASRFVGRLIQPLLSGSYTVQDQTLYRYLALLADQEALWLEPSALAGFDGPGRLLATEQGRQYLKDHSLTKRLEQALWLPWATGGSMVPRSIMEEYYKLSQA